MKTDVLRFFKPLKKKKPSKLEDVKKPPLFIRPVITPSDYRLLACMLLAVVTAVLLAPQLIVPKYDYRPGDIAKHNIWAPQDFSVEDTEATEKRRLQKTESIISVYDFNSQAEEELEKRITGAFAVMRDSLAKPPQREPEGFSESIYEQFQSLLKIQISQNNFNLLKERGFKKEIEEYLLELVLPFTLREIVISKEQLFKERGRGIMLRDIRTKEEIVVDEFSSLIDVKEAQILLKRDARKVLANVRTDVRRTIITLAIQLIEPTITFNKIATNARKTAAVQEVSPLYYNVKKGEVIVREGAKISESSLVKLKAITGLEQKKNMLWTLLGYFFLAFLTLHVLYRFTATHLSRTSMMGMTTRDFIFLGSILILSFLLLKFSTATAKVFSKGYTTLPLDACLYALPFAFTAIVISVVLSPQIAVVGAMLVSLFVCFLLDNRFIFFVYSFISAIVAAQEVGQSKERKTIIRAGLFVAATNAALILSFYLISGAAVRVEALISIGCGILGGVISAVLATGIIPIIEILFNYTTDIKLLELADLNQPVLRQLLITAPGTYHHSILVGILAEAAAEAIHANPLLARVCSYYHDIGKIKKPLYFVENQKADENKHDKLLPSMSSLILTKHVKDGVDIAKQHRLGKPIQDIICQHHGTSVISYFYQKAKEMQESTGQPVSEKDFRYPGPKPQTKEAGIVMLADAVQATSKTLSEPTPARIQGMVQRLINNIFVDGQLDECELTLKDLHHIAENFIRILNGIFHARIEYPEKSDKEANGKDLDRKPAKPDSDRPALDKTDGEKDLGRIGIKKSRNKHSAAG